MVRPHELEEVGRAGLISRTKTPTELHLLAATERDHFLINDYVETEALRENQEEDHLWNLTPPGRREDEGMGIS